MTLEPLGYVCPDPQRPTLFFGLSSLSLCHEIATPRASSRGSKLACFTDSSVYVMCRVPQISHPLPKSSKERISRISVFSSRAEAYFAFSIVQHRHLRRLRSLTPGQH